MNILFVTDAYPNYVPDLLLHGFRKLLGPAVVDFPRKESLYKGELIGITPDDQVCPDWFPPDDGSVDREDIPAKIFSGYFKYIICDVRAMHLFQNSISQLPPGLVIVDGEDFPIAIPPGPYAVCRRETDGTDHSIPLPMALPEEIFNWIASHDGCAKKFSIGFLGSVGDFYSERKSIVDMLSSRYKDCLLQTSIIPSADDPQPAGRVGRDDYYRLLQECRMVLNIRGAGFDTFRYWENAACSSVHVSQRMALFIPNDFVENRHILRFSDTDELIRHVDGVLEGRVNAGEIIQECRRHLKEHHLTDRRAAFLLDRLRKLFP